MPTKKAKPKFLRPNYGRSSRKRIKRAWRRQRGVDNKKRVNKAHMGASPSIGYGQDRRIRYLHPVGLHEALVHNLHELEKVQGAAVRIAASCSKRLKEKLVAAALSKNLRVLNSGAKKQAANHKGQRAKKTPAAAKQEEAVQKPPKEQGAKEAKG
ncbi:MAG: eL32 family ribosomal protein [Candidatus Micrarchaeota archaeon]